MKSIIKTNENLEPDSSSEYHYGTRLSLDKDTLKILGIEEFPEMGAKMKLNAIVEVVSLSQGEMGLQIVEMELLGTGEKRDISESLYGVPRDHTKEGGSTFVGSP